MSTKKPSKVRRKDPFFEREAARYAMPLPSREYIQQMLEEQGRPVFFERLCELLDIRKGELEPFERRLLAMEREAQIMRNRKGAFILPERASQQQRGDNYQQAHRSFPSCNNAASRWRSSALSAASGMSRRRARAMITPAPASTNSPGPSHSSTVPAVSGGS